VHEDLGMASTAENVATLFELVPELRVVENVAGGCKDDLTILVRERLPAASYIHDAQSHMREAHFPAGIESVTVGAPVPDRGSHASERMKRNAGRLVPSNPRYATHGTYLVEVARRARSGSCRVRCMFATSASLAPTISAL
jgi:hypothetical protein